MREQREASVVRAVTMARSITAGADTEHVFIFCRCYDRSPQTEWPEATQASYLTPPQGRRSARSPGGHQGITSVWSFLEGLGKNPFLCFSGFWRLQTFPQQTAPFFLHLHSKSFSCCRLSHFRIPLPLAGTQAGNPGPSPHLQVCPRAAWNPSWSCPLT